jgi:hypothetical protein
MENNNPTSLNAINAEYQTNVLNIIDQYDAPLNNKVLDSQDIALLNMKITDLKAELTKVHTTLLNLKTELTILLEEDPNNSKINDFLTEIRTVLSAVQSYLLSNYDSSQKSLDFSHITDSR